MKEKYSIEQHQNHEVATFHLSFKVPEIPYFSEPDTEDAKVLKNELLQVLGVVEVTSSKQAIRIHRGGVYSWNELEPFVIDLLKTFFKVDEFEKVSAYPDAIPTP